MAQDSSLDNLQHDAAYRPARLGTLGQVVRKGSGSLDVLIIAGWGFGASAFEEFMTSNSDRYRMVAVTLPGFGGTAAPPMPPANTSYSEGTWTRAAEEAIASLIRQERLHRPIVVGHFVVGTQVAVRLGVDHPDLIGGIVVVGGEPMRYMTSRRDTVNKPPLSADERRILVDKIMAPKWYKTVTKATFDTNNYRPAQYARDTARARILWKASSDVPLPVMVRYLCEYLAMDLSDDYVSLTVPTAVLVPSFSSQIFADPKQAYVRPLLVDSWNKVRGKNAQIEIRTANNSRIFVTDDRPDIVREAISQVASRAKKRAMKKDVGRN